MNTLVVPLSPNWYSSRILSCAPDNTLIYGSKNDLVIIEPKAEGNPSQITFLDRAHGQKIISVDVNIQWGSPNKWVVSAAEDNQVKLWDISNYVKISCHEAHKDQKDKLVGACFLTEDRVLSVSETGTLYIWHPSTKEHTKLNIFASKVTITCYAPCPHATFITAFGMKNGLIVVANLKKNGGIMFKLRGHTSEVVSLSWCPVPLNIFPSKPNNYIKGLIPIPEEKQIKIKDEDNHTNIYFENNQEDSQMTMRNTSDDSQISGFVDIPEGKSTVEPLLENHTSEENLSDSDQKQSSNSEIDNSFEMVRSSIVSKTGKKNPWANLKFVDDEDIEDENTQSTSNCVIEEQVDFLKECDILKKKIEGLSLECDIDDRLKMFKKDKPPMEKIISMESNELPTISSQDKGIEVPEPADESELNETKSNEPCTEVKLDDEEQPGEMLEETNSKPCDISEKNVTSTNNPLEEEPRKEFLLASSGKDSVVYIWRAGTDGRLQCFFKLPEKKSYSNKYSKQKVKDSFWAVLKWITPFTFLTNTKKGELIKYILPKPLNSQREYSVVHNEHSSLIFAIAAHVPNMSLDDLQNNDDTRIWTFGHDMYLLNTVINSKTKHLFAMETFCSLIQYLSPSPLDPGRIAVGLSNGVIKIWNTNIPHINNFSAVNYSLKINSKITCLAWHPINELICAFSTEEGTIGLLNTNNTSRASWFKQTFAKTVHKIQWRPCNFGKDEAKIGLYAAGGGDLLCFDPENTNEEPVRVNLPTGTFTYMFAWKLDGSILLVGDITGKLILLNPDYSVRAVYYEKKKLTSITWHPDSDCSSEGNSKKSFWAAAPMDNVVHILNFSEVCEKGGTCDIKDVTIGTLQAHQGNIKSLSWSPFNGNMLVSAGEDGFAHVWDVSTKQLLASYYGKNFDPIRTIIWSPLQEDMLICSGSSACLVVWKMSDYPSPVNEDILTKYKQHTKHEKRISTHTEETTTEKLLSKNKKANRNSILPALNTGNKESTLDKVKILQELLDWKEQENSTSTNGKPTIRQLFGTKEDVHKLLSTNERSHVEKGKTDMAHTVSFWKGDFQSSIKEACDQRKVTPLLISLAPTVSLNLWQKACETYAQQLEEMRDSDAIEIATYYLACQNIEKAIQCLCERDMFKEALALAKCRLPKDNVFLEDILSKWAMSSSYCGSLETAAQCYIALGRYEEATKVLFRRNELDILLFALDLARKTGNEELIKAVEFRCNAFSKGESSETDTPLPKKQDFFIENSDLKPEDKMVGISNAGQAANEPENSVDPSKKHSFDNHQTNAEMSEEIVNDQKIMLLPQETELKRTSENEDVPKIEKNCDEFDPDLLS